MTTLVTGAAGHLGQALVNALKARGATVRGVDIRDAPTVDLTGSIADADFVHTAAAGCEVVVHTATLHKPHVATFPKQAFIDTNVTGTLNLLEASTANGVRAFLFTSTTSLYGAAMRPPPGAPAVWVTEATQPIPRNIYGVSKTAAEDLCELFHRAHGLDCLILRTSRFFLEDDDDAAVRGAASDANVKANEFLNRRVDIADVVSAHLLAIEAAPRLGFDRFVISSATPFLPEDAAGLGVDAPAVLAARVPELAALYEEFGWSMFGTLDRVYDSRHAREQLGWQPRFGAVHMTSALAQAARDGRAPVVADFVSSDAAAIGARGYAGVERAPDGGPYPTAT